MLVDPEFIQFTDEQINRFIEVYKEYGVELTSEQVRSLLTPVKIDRGLYSSPEGVGLNFDFCLPNVEMDVGYPPQPQAPGIWYQYSFDLYKTTGHESNGVCDSPEQFMEKIGKILDTLPDEYVVGFDKISKKDQPPEGGWRWHKWGEYIGDQNPQYEYLYDEPEIEEIYLYNIFKRVSKS